jgi:hypothetical protein
MRYPPRMLRPSLILLPLLACAPTSGGDTGDTGDTGTASNATTSVPGTTTTGDTPTTAAPDTTGEPTTSTSTTTTGPADTTATTDLTGTTGDPAFCHGWQGADGPAFLDLHDKAGALLTDGSTLPIECGGQGLFMFGLYPTFGGFTPTGDILDFKLVVDVEGFNDNPEGHFYSADPVGYYVSCEDVVGGVIGVLPVFPFDNLEDLTALDGKPAEVHVTLPIGDEPIVVDLSVVLSVVKDDTWTFCGG